MLKVKDELPVYDICTFRDSDHAHNEIVAECFADYLKKHPNLHRAHGHTFYHLVLFTKGSGFHTIDFERFKVEVGQIYFMVPGQVHGWQFEGEMDGFVVNFSEELFHSFLRDERYLGRFNFWRGITGENILTLTATELKEAGEMLSALVTETSAVKPFSKDKVRLLLLSLFILVARSENYPTEANESVKPNLQLLYKFRDLVNEKFKSLKLPKDYAEQLHVSANHLNAVCTELLGKSAGEVIRERILLEAKRKLVNLDESISTIAYSLGFSDNSYFTKFFKKYTGMTPEEFKKSVNDY
ncbi:AraC family transcriptional regulator [Solitalea sp. MAHUQ-68]|uniref:AraC family transcriptional regulator n=1 Tax=Solitalea agri TaxID=2953739 RepID=A0A9X2F4X2_9SPHI|nr:helix-turn-helix transcriptional regulator [Solitalea agri]MCO4292396.1 AraC family transcriptional regulator [Solitalea agri]